MNRLAGEQWVDESWMTRRAIAAIALSLAASCAQAEPADTLKDLRRAFAGCSRVQGAPAEAGDSILRVTFSMRRDGSLFGQPRVAYAELQGDDATRTAFREAALSSFTRCFPIAITDGLGGAIAGRRFRAVLRR